MYVNRVRFKLPEILENFELEGYRKALKCTFYNVSTNVVLSLRLRYSESIKQISNMKYEVS